MAKGCQQLSNLERSQELLSAETLFGEIRYQIRNVEAAKVRISLLYMYIRKCFYDDD